jgi:D-3-phosphoglycerate dehydrogenase / 2-oxoglutarate reductase
MTKQILLIDTVHPVLTKKLENAGFVIIDKTKADKKEITNLIHKYHGAILRSRIIFDKKIIDKANKLEFIARVGAGMESIDTEYAKSKGISCFNSPEGNRDAVAEHCLGMLLSLSNNLIRANSQVKSGKWLREENRGFEIKGKTIAIIGYGNMGSAFAERLRGFGCNIIAYDKYKTNFGNDYVAECNMDKVFNECDILSLHVPLTEETSFLVNTTCINKFKKDIVLINSSRGQVVKTTDLLNGLEKGKIKGACLDVLEYEDTSFEYTKKLTDIPEFRKLSAMENVIMSPHIAGWTFESKFKLSDILADKIIKEIKP